MSKHRSAYCVVLALLIAGCGGQPPTAPSPQPSVPAEPGPSAPLPQPPPPSAPVVTLSFVGSEPAAGSEIVMTDSAGLLFLRDLTLHFAVRSPVPLPDAKLEVQLFNDAGQLCHYTFVDHAVPANETVTMAARGVIVYEMRNCPAFPMRIVTVKATLLTLRGPEVNGRLQRTDYASDSASTSFTVQRWPAPPPNPAPAPPVIADIYWKGFMAQPPDSPLPGDPITFSCKVTATDGAPVTITLTILWDGGSAPQVSRQAFAAGASSSPQGAVAHLGVGARSSHARATCEATNSRGETVRRTIDIGK
jgi:hypothetical protein